MEGGTPDPPHRIVHGTVWTLEPDLADESSRSPHAIPPPFNFQLIPVIDFRYAAFVIQDPNLLRNYACVENGGIEKLIDTDFCLGELLRSLSKILLDLASNEMGRSLIAYCFRKVEDSHTKAPLAYKMVQDCLDLATDKYGCHLLNACIPLMEETHQRSVLFIIWRHAHFLAQHCYGIYVVENAVSSTQNPKFAEKIVMKITSLFLVLSTGRDGSYLVERCISSCSTTKIAVKALVELKTAELKEIACNRFGNFVIQKALLCTKDSDQFLELHSKLQSALLPFLTDLKRSEFGRNVAYRLREL